MLHRCNAWELWRIRHPISAVLVVVNMEPMEGLPVVNQQVYWDVSVYFQEKDLEEYIGSVSDGEIAQITKEYLRIRRLDDVQRML